VATINDHDARAPQGTVFDLPPVVPAQRASGRSAKKRAGSRTAKPNAGIRPNPIAGAGTPVTRPITASFNAR